MRPKPARIQLAQPTLVFSAERDGMGKGQAGVGTADLQAQGTRGWERGPSHARWGSFAALQPQPLAACPSLPAPPGSSPSPLHHFCFIYEYVSGIQMSYLFCGRLTFPQRASACLTHGPAETAREEKQRAKEFFSALFYSSPHPSPGPHLILFCVCACVSGALLPGRAPLARPLPAFIPLALL